MSIEDKHTRGISTCSHLLPPHCGSNIKHAFHSTSALTSYLISSRHSAMGAGPLVARGNDLVAMERPVAITEVNGVEDESIRPLCGTMADDQ